MSHKIKTTKNYDDKYQPNYVLIILLAIGYPCFIIWLIGVIDNSFINILESVQIENIMPAVAILYIVINILSMYFIFKETNKINAELIDDRKRALKPHTWDARTWAWMTFLLWWFTLPLYLYHRKEIYRISKIAYEQHMTDSQTMGA